MQPDTAGRGLRRLSDILTPRGPIPVSRSTWYAGVRAGVFPQPIRLGARISCYRSDDIEHLILNGIDASKAAVKRPRAYAAKASRRADR